MRSMQSIHATQKTVGRWPRMLRDYTREYQGVTQIANPNCDARSVVAVAATRDVAHVELVAMRVFCNGVSVYISLMNIISCLHVLVSSLGY
jgi:hypothetical protein